MTAPLAVRVVVVEDEELARGALRDLLAEVDWIRVVGEAGDGLTAVRQIDALAPDLVFLDVQLPELDGLSVLERIRHDPLVVFTTAFDRYAVAAFAHEALDYLLKPFGRRRLQATLQRVRARLTAGEAGGAADAGAAAVRAEPRAGRPGRALRRLFVRRGSHIVPLPTAAVTRIETDGDHVIVWSGAERYSLSRPLADLEGRLDPERFRRIHRSQIVNLDHVTTMEFDGRRLILTCRGGARVIASRAASRDLRALIE